MSSSQLNPVLLEISNDLSPEQLEKMKFLCEDIGKKELEKIDTGTKLFRVLKERRKLDHDNTAYLCQLLTEICREDLSDKLKGLIRKSGSTSYEPPETEKAKLDIATEVISENLGRNWRKLGRKLGLTDVKLESISKRHPTELEETAVELLNEWRKNRGAEARAEDLIKTLRACQFNLTADKVEYRLATLEN
ncbi:FAS-associated death domain protein-like [Pagrus major]|uniref:FAS-associated death domain protein n=1 Tax=Pagrus major TaxID=143350 RepID=UPI003CC8D265